MDNIDIIDKIDKGFKKVNKLYENLNYFDQYGGSFLLFVIISIILILLISYCYVYINLQPIVNNWPIERCKPYIIPFAGLINAPPDMSANDYTFQNFNYCLQNTMSGVASTALTPITFVTNLLTSVVHSIENAINSIRAMINQVRTDFIAVLQEIMGRIMNMMIPLQQMIIAFNDLIAKTQGSMVAGLYTLLGAYFTLQSVMGAIAEFIIIILIALAAMIAVFWLTPFTVGLAITNTVIFLAIAIPMAIILAFMMEYLQVQPDLSIPTIQSCFDKDTLIKMNDGTQKKIMDIQVGETLFNGDKINAKFKLSSENCNMYLLNDIIVSDSHFVFYQDKCIPIYNHPYAIKLSEYNEPYLYCLNTSSKKIVINGLEFIDWDELYGESFDIINNFCINLNSLMFCNVFNTNNDNLIHKYLDSGFNKNTKITLNNGKTKNINDINVGDILSNGEKVYGIVEIDGSDLNAQYIYYLGNNFVFGGPNLIIGDKNFDCKSTLDIADNSRIVIVNDDKLYHLLTDKKTFYVNNIKFYDYNASIDLFLAKYR